MRRTFRPCLSRPWILKTSSLSTRCCWSVRDSLGVAVAGGGEEIFIFAEMKQSSLKTESGGWWGSLVLGFRVFRGKKKTQKIRWWSASKVQGGLSECGPSLCLYSGATAADRVWAPAVGPSLKSVMDLIVLTRGIFWRIFRMDGWMNRVRWITAKSNSVHC